ncbi:MAG TPA: (Fe-S)-binding protein [Dehalococcoidales bacterium]|nr:(Fe-S)-binding protein [Dehalococcoidales bacterium]
MKTTTTLEDIRGAATLCIKCGNCTYAAWPLNHPLCPIYYRDRCYTHSAGGLLYLVLALLNKKIDFTQQVADLAFACTGCLGCDSQCGIIRSQAPHVDPWDIIRLLRAESVRHGFIPDGRARQIHAELQKRGDLGQAGPLKLSAKVSDPKAGTVVFAECSHTAAHREISGAMAALLEKIGSPVAQFAEKGCCGSTLYDLGFWDQVRPLIEANWAKMKSFKDRTFVFVNPHCQEFVTRRYPETVPASADLKKKHFTELLADAFRDGKLKSRKAGKITVSYHDPCYLGRGLGIYDAPRRVLASLDGVKLVEMERNRENSFCCGSRASGSYFPGMAEWTARERLKDFAATGADLLVTACAYCRDSFRRVMPDGNKVKDISELVNERT